MSEKSVVEGSDIKQVQVVLLGVFNCHGVGWIMGGEEYFESWITGRQHNSFVFT